MRGWIPPLPFAAAQCAHGASWVVLFLWAQGDLARYTIFGWTHLVALGWLTLTALAVLIHVVPAFTDVAWRAPGVARASLIVYMIGVAILLAGFFAYRTILWVGGSVIAAALAVFVAVAVATLLQAKDRVERAIARALGFTFIALLLAASLGTYFTFVVSGWSFHVAPTLPRVHAEVAMLGWLTLLTMGVSARTVGPITGARSPRRWAHIASGILLLVGLIVLAGATAAVPEIDLSSVNADGCAVIGGGILVAAGILVYVYDVGLLVLSASVSHRAPQAFMGSALLWLALVVPAGSATMRGKIEGDALIFLGLVGWIGQMVNAHVHHIGVRVIATMVRGDDDETRPGALLNAPVSWIAFGCSQLAVLGSFVGFVINRDDLLSGSAIAGFAGWLAIVLNVGFAWRRAHAAPVVLAP